MRISLMIRKRLSDNSTIWCARFRATDAFSLQSKMRLWRRFATWLLERAGVFWRGWPVASGKNRGQRWFPISCFLQGECVGEVNWDLVGDHNVDNALMAIAAARHVGVTPDLCLSGPQPIYQYQAPFRAPKAKSMVWLCTMILRIIPPRLNDSRWFT